MTVERPVRSSKAAHCTLFRHLLSNWGAESVDTNSINVEAHGTLCFFLVYQPKALRSKCLTWLQAIPTQRSIAYTMTRR